MDWLAQLLFFAAIAAVFWLLLIRPNVRRQRQTVAMQEALKVGDRIMLTSGFVGTLVSLEEDRVEVEIAAGTTVTVARGAVGSVVPPTGAETDADQTGSDAVEAARDSEDN